MKLKALLVVLVCLSAMGKCQPRTRKRPVTPQSPIATDDAGMIPIAFIRYSTYASGFKDYLPWFEVKSSSSKHWLIRALPFLALAGTPFLFSAGLWRAEGQRAFNEAILTLPLYVGSFGIIWTMIWIHWAFRKLHRCYEFLRPCLLVTDEQYVEIVHKRFSMISSKKGHLVSSVFVISFFVVPLIYFAFYGFDEAKSWSADFVRPSTFPSVWYDEGHRKTSVASIAGYGVIIATLLTTAVWVMVANLVLLMNIRRFQVVPLPYVVQVRLREVSELYSFATFGALIGMGLFAIVLRLSYDYWAFTFTGVFFLLATVHFLVPQFVYRGFSFRQ